MARKGREYRAPEAQPGAGATVGVEAEVRVESLGLGGDGIARLDKTVLFVPYAAPGDRLRVALECETEGGRRARIVERLSDGPERAAPPCPHFADCGGCSLQHLAPAAYCRWKQGLVGEALARRGIAASVAPLLAVPPGNRRRAVLAAEVGPNGPVLGFNAAGSDRVVDLSLCLLLTPRLVRLLEPLRSTLPSLLRRGECADVMVTQTESGIDMWLKSRRPPGEQGRAALLALAESQDLARVNLGATAEPLVQRRRPRCIFGKVEVFLPAGAFLQPSAPGEAALVRAASAVLSGRRRLLDLFAGCGAFSFPLAASSKVHAVEGDSAAEASLAAAARGLGGRVTSERRDLARAPLSPEELNRFDAMLLDPPRAGARAQAGAIAASRLDLVVYVSCDPRSFARDARVLIDGGFRLERVVPVDQFPWSAHLELLGVFRR